MIRLGAQELKYINMFEAKTGATVKDCIINGDDITLLIKEGQMGLAIGKGGSIINRIKDEWQKELHVYEHSDDPTRFVANLFYPVKVEKVEIGETDIKVYVDPAQKRRAIGKEGKKIRKVRQIIERHLGISNIKVI